MRRQRFVFLMCVLFALIAVVGIGCKNQFLEKPTFGSSNVANNEQATGPTTGSVEGFGAPSGLKSTQGGYREITLSWNPVPDAVRYYVYRANTQFETFIQVGETGDSSTSYTMKVQSGADFYYRVTAVNHTGKESKFSAIVRGTSLAQPLVSGIEGVEGKEDSDVTVYWYMGNVDAYQKDVRYNVICYDEKGTELARVVVDGSKVNETAAVISGLIPNTSYTYAVEAYIVSAQDKVEKCNPIDAATARRLRPNAPENLVVQQGQSKDGITLSFNLPALVDVALPGGVYEQKPLYFKIYRREYEAGVEESQKTKKFQLIKDGFGLFTDKDGKTYAESGEQLVKFGASEESYTPGNTVTWTDTDDALDRGVKYEYKVQSFAYVANRDISSDMSVATNHGWLIAPATFGTDEYSTVKDNADTPEVEATKNVAATLKFAFDFETMGVNYHYILAEEHWSLETDGTNNQSVPKSTTPNLIPLASVNDINTYERKFEISEKTRGYYKYKLYIMTQEQHEISEATLEVIAIGKVLVTHELSLPVIKLFSVENTQDNKIKLSWDFNKDYKYAIKYSEDDAEEVDLLNEFSTTTVGTLDRDKLNDDGTISFIDNQVEEGKTRVYILYALESVTVSSLPIPASTFATPKPKQTSYAYDSITVQWDDVVADSFTINATYKDGNVAKKYPIESGTKTKRHATDLAKEPLDYKFEKPNGYDKYDVSGLPVKITVQAHVTPKKITHTLRGTEGSSYQETTEDLASITLEDTKEFLSHTMGPANVNAKASQALNQDNITLTWDKVEGATAYAIIRNRMHIDSSSKKVFQSTDTYVVDANGDTPTVSLASSSEDVSANVTITATSTEKPTYTLTDSVITDLPEGASKWQTSQSQISWGAPYEYTVLPLLAKADEITYDYESSKTNITLSEITLSEVDFKVGGTTGYGWNVVASKGDYISGDSNENTAVKITWTKPWFATDNTIYTVYRREENTANWEVVSDNISVAQGYKYINAGTGEKSATPGTVYEYAVGITNKGHPGENGAYNQFTSQIKDELHTTEKAASGFVLPQPKISSVSRDAKYGTDKEQLVWGASQVGKQANRMFEGYIVEVMNNNIDTDWHEIARFTFGQNDFDKNAGQYTEYIYNKNDLLKVLRDYKHYFRIRAFTNGGEVVSKAPDYTWSDGKYDDFVKWGTRQLTAAEYNKCVTLVLAYGLRLINGTEWNTGYFGRNKEATSPGSGSVNAESDFWVNNWTINYSNYCQGYTTKSGRVLPSFLTVNGTLQPKTGASNQYPKSYSTSSGITVTGPSDVNGMYNGTITFSSSSGNSSVSFTGGSGSFSYSKDSSYSPLPMTGGDYKVDSEEWK